MSKPSLIILLALIVLWVLLAVSTQTSWRGTIILIGSMSILIWPLMLYFPAHVLRSLRQEWQKTGHLWLHTTLSGWSLLSSKLAVGLAYFAAYLVVIGGFFSWFVFFGIKNTKWPTPGLTHPIVMQNVFPNLLLVSVLVFLAILTFGIYLGLWAALISVSMQAVKNSLHKLAWLLGIGIFLIPTWGFSELYRISFVRNLLNAGTFQIHFLVHDVKYVANNGQQVVGYSANQAYFPMHTGEIIFYVAICAILFYLAGWILEKKVEV